MAVEANEIIVLLIIVIGYIPIILAYLKNKHTKWLFISYTMLLIGAVATVAEGFVYPKELNYIEHIFGVMGAGILFFVCAYLNNKRITSIQQEITKKIGQRGK